MGKVTWHFRNCFNTIHNTYITYHHSPVEQIVQQFPLLSVFPLSNAGDHVHQNLSIILLVYQLQLRWLVEGWDRDIVWEWWCEAQAYSQSYITYNTILQLLAGRSRIQTNQETLGFVNVMILLHQFRIRYNTGHRTKAGAKIERSWFIVYCYCR